MKAAIPLARSLSHAVVSPTSRIPHLQWHITRNARARRARTPRVTQRSYSLTPCPKASLTFDPWSEQYEETSSVDQSIRSQVVKHEKDETTRPNYEASELLAEACPERVLYWLSSTDSGARFTTLADDALFERFFATISPAVMFDHFKQHQRYLYGMKAVDNDDHLRFARSLIRRMRSFTNSLVSVLDRRRQKRELTIPICQHALYCAAAVGDARAAQRVWQVMMPATQEPDLDCYNAYMQAFTWNLAYSEQARVNYRIWSESIRQRGLRWRRRGFLGYDISRVNPDSTATLKGKFLSIFKELSAKGLDTNEATFANMIAGFGKSGDLYAAESVLRSVWNIDVASLQIYDEEELPSPTYYPDDDPRRPTSRLLGAIVHAYCINNQIDKALFVLDYTSRNYALDVPANLWEDFLEWAHVLSTKRGLSRQKQGQDEGKIHPKKVEEYYSRIIDVPHSVQPTTYMKLILARSLQQRRLLDRTLEILQQVRSDLHSHLESLQTMVEVIKESAKPLGHNVDEDMVSAEIIELRRRFQAAYLAATGVYGSLNRHVRRVLTEDDWPGAGKETEWCRRKLPQIREQFREYSPPIFEYKTNTGHVRLCDKDQVRKGVASNTSAMQMPNLMHMGKTRRTLAEASIVWHELESDDLSQIRAGLGRLPRRLDAFRNSQGRR